MFQSFITFASVLAALSVASAAPDSFKAGTICWPDTGGEDLNRRVGFRVILDSLPADAVLRLATSGPNYVLTFSRDDATEAVAPLFVQHGPNLAAWTDVPIDATSSGPNASGITVTVTENGALPDTITVTLPSTIASQNRLFIRLKTIPSETISQRGHSIGQVGLDRRGIHEGDKQIGRVIFRGQARTIVGFRRRESGVSPLKVKT